MDNNTATKNSGFLYNISVYFLSMIIASAFPFAARFITSFFIETPALSDLKADASYLFNVVYPIMGVVTIAAFLAGGFICCYFTAYKIAYKVRTPQKKNKITVQIVTSLVAAFAYNTYVGFMADFTGVFGLQFWYPSALTASLFSMIDKNNVLMKMANSDFSSGNFIIVGLNIDIGFITLTYAIILSIAFGYFCLKGRSKGEKAGIEAINQYINDMKAQQANTK